MAIAKALPDMSSYVPEDDWRSRAGCIGKPADFFFPEGRDAKGAALEAKRFCWAECDVREACLEYALTYNENEGIWGGTSEVERRRIKRLRRAGIAS